jgi:P-type Cu+ transporter
MIIACPCTLGLATRAALMMDAGKDGEKGILYKGDKYIEIANKVNTVVFDKTRTLTVGKPSVTNLISLTGNIKEQELLKLAVIAESGSEHPLSQAVIRKAKKIIFQSHIQIPLRQFQDTGSKQYTQIIQS